MSLWLHWASWLHILNVSHRVFKKHKLKGSPESFHFCCSHLLTQTAAASPGLERQWGTPFTGLETAFRFYLWIWGYKVTSRLHRFHCESVCRSLGSAAHHRGNHQRLCFLVSRLPYCPELAVLSLLFSHRQVLLKHLPGNKARGF